MFLKKSSCFLDNLGMQLEAGVQVLGQEIRLRLLAVQGWLMTPFKLAISATIYNIF